MEEEEEEEEETTPHFFAVDGFLNSSHFYHVFVQYHILWHLFMLDLKYT
jgi:hypothetical protein